MYRSRDYVSRNTSTQRGGCSVLRAVTRYIWIFAFITMSQYSLNFCPTTTKSCIFRELNEIRAIICKLLDIVLKWHHKKKDKFSKELICNYSFKFIFTDNFYHQSSTCLFHYGYNSFNTVTYANTKSELAGYSAIIKEGHVFTWELHENLCCW